LQGEDWTANAKNVAPPKVVHDKYVFNRTDANGQFVKPISRLPELIRQGDLDVLAKWPDTVIFALQRQRYPIAADLWEMKRIPTAVCEKREPPTTKRGILSPQVCAMPGHQWRLGTWIERYKLFWRERGFDYSLLPWLKQPTPPRSEPYGGCQCDPAPMAEHILYESLWKYWRLWIIPAFCDTCWDDYVQPEELNSNSS
jgi:hypothetical protein